MKKKLFSALLCATMVVGLLAGCGGGSSSSQGGGEAAGGDSSARTYAIVTKSAGNPYNEREAAGFKEVIELLERFEVRIVFHDLLGAAEQEAGL